MLDTPSALEIALEAKAVEYCKYHEDTLVDSGCDESHREAYKLASRYAKGEELKSLRDEIKRVIDEAAFDCSWCEIHNHA